MRSLEKFAKGSIMAINIKRQRFSSKGLSCVAMPWRLDHQLVTRLGILLPSI